MSDVPDSSPSRRSREGRGSREGRTAGVSHLPDPWSRRGALPLDGALERGGGLAPWLAALLVLVGAFVVFQVIGAVATSALLIAREGAGALGDPAAVQGLITATDVVVGNSIGQVLGLAGPVLLMAWLHSSAHWGGFLRLRRVPWALMGLALLGMVGLQPVVGALTQLNAQVPLPEFFRGLEEMRTGVIRQVLESGLGPTVNLLGLAVVPAVCEELLFRGYAQRQLERSAGAAGGVALSGLLFGLYHLSPAQVVPLSVLGGYLAYLTWRTGSLWPAVGVHFANNAFAVVSVELATARPGVSLEEVEATAWPGYAVAGGALLFAAVAFVLHTRAPRWRPDRRGERPAGGPPDGT
jgi:membrane protease YdiL (CAAX protease family)